LDQLLQIDFGRFYQCGGIEDGIGVCWVENGTPTPGWVINREQFRELAEAFLAFDAVPPPPPGSET
jgi:hypothetical protein